MKRASSLRRSLPIALAIGGALTSIACSGRGNTGRSPVSDELAALVPWVNGRRPLIDSAGQVVIPSEPVFPAIARGLPDEDSREPDCSALAGLEFSSAWFEDFESLAPDNPDAVGVAPAWSSYDDYTENSFHVPGDINWYSGLAGRTGATWGLPSERVSGAPSCDGAQNDWVLHFKGGRFNRFGAGLGHPLALLEPCPDGSDVCPPEPEPGSTTDSAGLPLLARSGEAYAQAHNYWDLSAYDGIAFWARRGPESMGNMLVILFEKHTSDDLARENETFCRRLKPCRSACVNRSPCSPVDPDMPDSVYRCFEPSEGALPVGLDPALLDLLYPRCGPSACSSPSTFVDNDFDGKSCRPYTFATHESAEYCFNADDPPPPGNDERCGDGFARTVQLSSDWKFFKVPFSELRQQGFGKRAPYMDLTSVSNIAFAFSHGWVDAYIDNVTFYRDAN